MKTKTLLLLSLFLFVSHENFGQNLSYANSDMIQGEIHFVSRKNFGQNLSYTNSDIVRGEIHFKSGEFKNALADFKAALVQFKRSNSFNEEFDCQLRIAETQTRLGNAKASLELCTILEKEVPSDDELIAKYYSIKGDALLNLGRNAEAIDALSIAEKKFISLNNTASVSLSNCYNDLGIAYWNNGNNDLALKYLQNSLLIRKEAYGEKHEKVAASYNNIGLVNAENSTFAAVLSFKKALGIYEDLLSDDHPKIALTLNNLALQYEKQENYIEALNYLNQVYDIWNRLYTEDHPNKAFTAFSISKVHYRQKNYLQAEIFEKKAIAMYLNLYGEKHPEVANIYNLEGKIYLAQSKFGMSIASFHNATYASLSNQSSDNIFDQPKLGNYYNADILLSSLHEKSNAFEKRHYNKSLKFRDLKAALASLELADELISHIRRIRLNEKDKLALSATASEIYETGVTLSFNMSQVVVNPKIYHERAFDFAEKSKSSVLLSAIQDTNAKEFSGIPSELLETESILKSSIVAVEQGLATNTNPSKEVSLKKKILIFNNLYNDFVKKLEVDYPNYYNLKFNVNHISLTDLQSSLGNETALITHFITDEKVYTFYVSSSKFKISNAPKILGFDKKILVLRNAIKYDAKEAFINTSKELYAQLFPIAIESKINQLVIIPEGQLATVPFETLITDKKVETSTPYNQLPYLIKKYNISYDNSATLYVQRKKEIERYQGESNSILLVAPVNFKSYEYQGLNGRLNDLPGSKSEINEIKFLFQAAERKAVLLVEKDANKTKLLSNQLKYYKYIHLATHGMVDQSAPNLSRVFLTPDGDQSGSLFSREVYNININAGLVCLSACETGLGKLSKGEGIIGLSRALLYAGAKNLIVSLWTVSDSSTSDLMVDFYKQHLYSPTYNTFGGALRMAKISLMSDEVYSKPYYWAPFILIGE